LKETSWYIVWGTGEGKGGRRKEGKIKALREVRWLGDLAWADSQGGMAWEEDDRL